MVSSPIICIIDIPGEPRWDRGWRHRKTKPCADRRAKVKAARKAAQKNRKRKQRSA